MDAASGGRATPRSVTSAVISAAGVIASLIFVGIQVRQSVKAARSTAFQSMVSGIIATNMTTLAISRGFVEAMHGTITAANRNDRESPRESV